MFSQIYSSGIYCINTPQFDDLFGFSVQDVKMEANRGRRLVRRSKIVRSMRWTCLNFCFSFVGFRFVLSVRKEAAPLGVKWDAVRSLSITLVLLRREPKFFKIKQKKNMGQFDMKKNSTIFLENVWKTFF